MDNNMRAAADSLSMIMQLQDAKEKCKEDKKNEKNKINF